MTSLARILWRLMPRALRRAMAIEAPVVLFRQSGPCASWLRHEVKYSCTDWLYDDGCWTFRIPGLVSKPYTFEVDAFAALTAELRKRKDVVLLGDE